MIYLDVLVLVVVFNKLLWCNATILTHKFQLVITCKKIQIRHHEKIQIRHHEKIRHRLDRVIAKVSTFWSF